MFKRPTLSQIPVSLSNAHKVVSASMKTDLFRQFKLLGISDPEINIRLVEHLNRHTETGKLKRFKCL